MSFAVWEVVYTISVTMQFSFVVWVCVTNVYYP